MEFLAEVRPVGGSGGFRPYKLPAVPSPINIVSPYYNSDEDSDYDNESSSHSTDEDEHVPNTPAAGDIDVRHVEDPSMESVVVEYNTDGGVEFTVGHRMPNRKAVLTAVKNYSIRRNAEYKVIESDRLEYQCRCKHYTTGCP
ncbi:hypothetical protein PIB30_039976 [Stylosanthes scabra]|uniref:Transposase MuDR plant domain-containing protein n=1 Tax=Stylosanthes scabra TaxID=79078 RepID=A0ABU6VDH1_9FABA|nr:hypothetical protein [Stylosanthes scabra]